MTTPPTLPRILLIESNVYFAKRLGDALQQQGFEVVTCAQAAYALTMVKWSALAAILCATNLHEMSALEIAPILRTDPKTANMPLIAIGGGSGEQALLEAFRAGCGVDAIITEYGGSECSRRSSFELSLKYVTNVCPSQQALPGHIQANLVVVPARHASEFWSLLST